MKRSPAAKDKTARPDDPKTILIEGARALGIHLTPLQIAQFSTYLSELLRWNQKVNLTGIRQAEEIVVKHFLDSLTPLRLIDLIDGNRWMDVGTGAGFPGLVLKLARPDLEMALVEASEKRATFLHHLIGLLDLTGVLVHQSRLERLAGGGFRRAFDLVTTRALSPSAVLEKGKEMVRPGGRMLFFQGRADRGAWERLLQGHPDLVLSRLEPVALPFTNDPRTLILLKVG